MKQRGRKSSDALGALGADDGPVSYLRAPAELSLDERRVWQETVEGKPVDYFGSEQAPVLVEYVCAVCRGRVIRNMLAEHLEGREASNDWKREFMRLNQLADKSAQLVQVLARSMRLTHQAVIRAEKVTPKKGQTLWQRAA